MVVSAAESKKIGREKHSSTPPAANSPAEASRKCAHCPLLKCLNSNLLVKSRGQRHRGFSL